MNTGIHIYPLTHGEWIHLDYRKEAARNWLATESKLDPLVIRALQLKEPRPRTHFQDKGILLSLRGINLNPDSMPNDMVGLRIWIDKDRIITSNHRKLQSINEVIQLVLQKRGGSGPFNIFILITQKMISLIDDAIDQYEESQLDLETEVLEKQGVIDRIQLMEIRKQLISLRRYLTPQREAFTKLLQEPLPWVKAEQYQHLREVGDHLVRILENLDALRERAVIIHEEHQNRISEQLNNRIYRLSVISAIFLPLSFLTGLLGINVGGIPGANSSTAFGGFLIILSVIVLFQLLFFKWRKWL